VRAERSTNQGGGRPRRAEPSLSVTQRSTGRLDRLAPRGLPLAALKRNPAPVDATTFIAQVRDRIDAHLGRYLADKHAEAEQLSPRSLLLVDGVAALTTRGGKRLRPALAAAAHRAVTPGAPAEATDDLGAAFELLQSFLLIHDDWMDGDDERRGGPAVHAAFRERVGDRHLANALAVLAGDLAGAYAWELFLRAPWPSHARRDAEARFLAVHKEVFFGHHLDLTADADVARMHQLKTGSYTVRGPLALGALLGGANAAQIAALDRAAEPLGEAFQLADDLLGTFGNPRETGKPAGNDLRAGKRNAVVVAAEASIPEAEREPMRVVLGGGADVPQNAVERAIALLTERGVRAHVEERVEELLNQGDAALAAAPLDPDGVALLRAMAGMLARRHR
jgi:geranylgeranyl diphosphate synthase, type I